jgi:hypothetical protein
MAIKSDEKLDEVKAILRRLQRINAGDDGAAIIDQDSLREAPRTSPDEATFYRFPASESLPARESTTQNSAGQDRRPPRRRSGAQPIAILGLIAVALTVGLVVGFWPKTAREPVPIDGASRMTQDQGTTAAITPLPSQSPSPAARPEPDPGTGVITNAQRLIDAGQIKAGRDLLANGLADRNADAALILARSYDPNSLRLIPNADAGPDIAAAERWYRRWHEIAAGEGLDLDSQRLDRIIKAMK